MALYEPVQDGTGVFSGGVGKDSPYGKATGLFKPRLSGNKGRIGTIVSGINYGSRYFRKNPRFAGRIAAVATGAAVRYASSGKYQKAFYPGQSVRNYSRKRKQYHSCKCRLRSRSYCIPGSKRRRYN